MGDLTPQWADLTPPLEARRVSYETWCQCARLLLGATDDTDEIRPDLYAAGLTPLAAVRTMVLGHLG